MASTSPVLTVSNVGKSFGRVTALRDASLEVSPGEVLAVVGDNGAGKSSLLKIMSGSYIADTGSVKLNGRAVQFKTPADARREGIGTVSQDLGLVEVLDVATNMALGDVPHRGPFVDRRAMDTSARKVLSDLNIRIDSVRMQVGLLSGGQRQIIAIARAVRLNSPIVLLDEPTAALGVRETAHVADIIDGLRAQGKAIVLISHDLDFVFQHADRVMVMRLGTSSATRVIKDTTREEIVGLITGAISADRHIEQGVEK
jgi:ABC-type sugar transport system ATPase subunit